MGQLHSLFQDTIFFLMVFLCFAEVLGSSTSSTWILLLVLAEKCAIVTLTAKRFGWIIPSALVLTTEHPEDTWEGRARGATTDPGHDPDPDVEIGICK